MAVFKFVIAVCLAATTHAQLPVASGLPPIAGQSDQAMIDFLNGMAASMPGGSMPGGSMPGSSMPGSSMPSCICVNAHQCQTAGQGKFKYRNNKSCPPGQVCCESTSPPTGGPTVGPTGPIIPGGPTGPIIPGGATGPIPGSPAGPIIPGGATGPIPGGPAGPIIPGGATGPIPWGPTGPIPAGGPAGPIIPGGATGPMPWGPTVGPMPTGGPAGPIIPGGATGPMPWGPTGPIPGGPTGPIPGGPTGSIPWGPSGPIPGGPAGPIPGGPTGSIPGGPTGTTSTPGGCGKIPDNLNDDGVVSKSGFADPEEFPWTIAVYKNGKFLCGGSLINYRAVLAAAHNFRRTRPASLVIRAGDHDRSNDNEMYPHQEIGVGSIVIHENYTSESKAYDAALLFLLTNINLAPNIAFVCLPPPAVETSPSTMCTATGWGSTNVGGQYQDKKKIVDLPIVDRTSCLTAILAANKRINRNFKLHESLMCAGGAAGEDTCKGDGGAPLVCPYANDDERFYQAGITSWGVGCGKAGVPGVYTSVAHVRQWIDLQMTLQGMAIDAYTPPK